MQKSKIKIAIIDDSSLSIHLIQKIILKIIADTNIKLRKFSDGEQFIYATNYSQETYDLVITDFSMPKKNGFEVLKFIRKQERINETKKKTFIMMISGHKIEGMHNAALKHGADCFIAKPYKPDNVESKIKEYIIEIFRLQNRVLPKREVEIENDRRFEINIELLIHKLRVYLTNYKEEFVVQPQLINEMFLFFNVLPKYINADEEFKEEFFGEDLTSRIEDELLVEKEELKDEMICEEELREVAKLEREIHEIIQQEEPQKREHLPNTKNQEEKLQNQMFESMKKQMTEEIKEQIMKELLQGLNKR